MHNIDIFILHKIENKVDTEVCDFNYDSKVRISDKCKFALKLIRPLTVFQYISIKGCTKMPIFPTLCITGNLE